MNAKQASNLLTLAWFLKTEVSDDHYVQSAFVKSDSARVMQVGGLQRQYEMGEISCGTSACALGWATVVFPNKFQFNSVIMLVCVEEDLWEPAHNRESREAICDFFGLTFQQIDDVFYSIDHCTVREKVAQLEELAIRKGYWYG